ncbi:hypothetical protein E1B28_003548 [Marasmius oreades]|uniref:RBR-type E3 ubiquitin transferase n=1 Tax=Marasmius oreades TaxID=181124 RepID=A0A9P7UML2_9AGAR|nr:uncharacterized protein E1B28_003548 [Marasmius oreades]KAG7086026.1 hypothetical protein E1B28_003548 [Marasmius oreades]
MDDLDCLLIAQLHLQDVQIITDGRKGKSKEHTPLTDEELAFQIQADILNDHLLALSDKRFAESLNNAVESDLHLVETIGTVEQAAEDDHRYAIALSHSQPLPEKTAAQRIVEDSEALNEQPGMIMNSVQGDDESVTIASGSTVSGTISRRNVACAICTDNFDSRRVFHAQACGHFYCVECLVNLIRACIGDESLYPLRCCRQNLSVPDILPRLDLDVRRSFEVKTLEYDVEPNNRLYCSNPVCSAFLGSTAGDKRTVSCSSCKAAVCTGCKKQEHAGGCTENEGLLQVQALAREQRWPTCPGCNAIIELHHGCYHMTCRCRTQFCYLCAAPWKNCQCPQWEEARLLETAQLRVQNEMGPRVDVNVGAAQERVQQRIQDFRTYHDCDPHRWRTRWGGGNCEECGYYLPQFLKLCRGCSILACVRCTRNRL